MASGRGRGASSGGAAHDDGHGGEHERRDHVKELRREQSISQSLTRRRRTKKDVDIDKATLKHIRFRYLLHEAFPFAAT